MKEENKPPSEGKHNEKSINLNYQPMDYSEIKKYKNIKVLYELPLSPCKIYLISEEGSNKVSFFLNFTYIFI